MRGSISEFSREHKWEIVLGLVFAVLFGLAWEVGKHTLERAEHVEPDRLAAGTVRVMTAVNLKTDAQRNAVAAWEKDHPSTIVTRDFAILTSGSGFAVSDDGWIVTARHVVRPKSIAPLLAATGAKSYILILYPPRTEREASLIEVDDKHDTALLKTVNAPPATFLLLGHPEEVHRLDRVFAAGYPDAADFSSPFEPSLTAGEITKVGEEGPFGTMLQTTAPIGSGNSGGPLIDREGQVIGINIGIPADKRLAIGFAVSIEHAAHMLARRRVALPSAYETQGVLRQPWVVGTVVAAGGSLILALIGVSLRSLWRRRFKTDADPPYAGLWVRFAALLLDLAITIPLWILLVVLLIVATGSFLPWYGFILGILPTWCLYAALCEWRWGATIGKQVAGLEVRGEDGGRLPLGSAFLRSAAHFVSALPLLIGFIAAAFEPRRRAWHDRMASTVVVETRRRSPWTMLVAGAFAFALVLVSIALHWGFLGDRASRDLQQVHARLWPAAGVAPGVDIQRLLATATDRHAFFHWTAMRARESVRYDYGLDLMLAGRPQQAVGAFQSVAGAPWETFGRGTGVGHTTEATAAATKAAWCYFDAGDSPRARRMFELLGSSSNLDAALGLGVTQMRLGDREAAHAACLQAEAIDRRAVERLRGSNPNLPVPEPFSLTPSQLRAVQQMLALCGEPRTPVTPPAFR